MAAKTGGVSKGHSLDEPGAADRLAWGQGFATRYFLGGAAFLPAPSAGWAVILGVASVVPA